jgi:hypothetical protein
MEKGLSHSKKEKDPLVLQPQRTLCGNDLPTIPENKTKVKISNHQITNPT